jgi:malonyl-CoA O-methyltransferase
MQRLRRLAGMSLGPGTSALTPTMVDPPRVPARPDTVRAQFARRPQALAAHGFLLREVARRLDDRLDVIRLVPATIVDVGCGRGEARALLRARYPRANWIGVDFCVPMLVAGRPAHRPALTRRWAARLAARLLPGLRRFADPDDAWLCAAADTLPLRDAAADLVWSNLMLHWHPTPHLLFPEWRRILRPEGLLTFSAFGPDTLRELRTACAIALPGARPMPFIDMHDFGDMLVASGFVAPVMEAETLRLTYASPRALLQEVRALGGNPRDDRAPGLPGSRQARALLAALDAQRGADGRIALSFEVIHGHAWNPAARPVPSAADTGVTRISVDHLRAQLRGR